MILLELLDNINLTT